MIFFFDQTVQGTKEPQNKSGTKSESKSTLCAFLFEISQQLQNHEDGARINKQMH